MASAAANRALNAGDTSSDYTYRHMEDALRRLSGMPGQRKLVLISPGFIISTLLAERVDMIDRSNRAGVVIDTVDARGLYTPDVAGDIASPAHDSFRTAGYKASYRVSAQSAQSEILDDLALGTGGTFYQQGTENVHNSDEKNAEHEDHGLPVFVGQQGAIVKHPVPGSASETDRLALESSSGAAAQRAAQQKAVGGASGEW